MSNDGPPYTVKFHLWKETEDGRLEKTVEGFYNEPTPIDCVNAFLYDIRGEKSEWELAYVDSVEPAGEDDE